MIEVYLPHQNLTVVLRKRQNDAGTDLTVYVGTPLHGNEHMTSVIATDTARVLEDVFERANATSADPLSKDLEGKSWRHIGYWLSAHLPRDGQLRRFVNEALKYLPKDDEHDPVDVAHQAGVEATLRARIATLETALQQAYDMNGKAETTLRARIDMLERKLHVAKQVETNEALIGQRDAWRDIAQKLNVILCNQDPYHV